MNARECKPRVGWATRESPPCTTSVICLAGLAGECPNVCTQEMTDSNSHAPTRTNYCRNSQRTPAKNRHTAHEAVGDRPTHADIAESMDVFIDGAISACAGRRSLSSQRSSDSSPTRCRSNVSRTARTDGRRPAPQPAAERTSRPASGTPMQPQCRDGNRRRARSRSPTLVTTAALTGPANPVGFLPHREPEGGDAHEHADTQDESESEAESEAESERVAPPRLARDQSRGEARQLRQGPAIQPRTRGSNPTTQAGPRRGRQYQCTGGPAATESRRTHR